MVISRNKKIRDEVSLCVNEMCEIHEFIKGAFICLFSRCCSFSTLFMIFDFVAESLSNGKIRVDYGPNQVILNVRILLNHPSYENIPEAIPLDVDGSTLYNSLSRFEYFNCS